MKMRKIGIDLGDTLFDRSQKIQIDGKTTYPLFAGAKSALLWWKLCDYELSIISKIDRGAEERVLGHLRLAKIVPDMISESNVYFCFERSEKGAVIKRTNLMLDIMIDDRVEALNAVDAAFVRHKILFIGGHDDREKEKLAFEGVHIARSWDEIKLLVASLP